MTLRTDDGCLDVRGIVQGLEGEASDVHVDRVVEELLGMCVDSFELLDGPAFRFLIAPKAAARRSSDHGDLGRSRVVPPALVERGSRQYQVTPTRTLRNRLVEAHLHLADYHVARFARSSGTAADDLRQTALIALMNAVERFDPENGASFRTFASRTIEGELKRHLRDRTWTVRPPRRAQERSTSCCAM